jgi:Dolichyl-phosphate-mannose-protein mannosyltransferase
MSSRPSVGALNVPRAEQPARSFPALRYAAPVAAVALLALMLAVSRDFGATWDERALQKYGEQIWDYYTGAISRSGIDISFGYTRIYGGLVEFASAAAQHLVRADVYVVRHMVNAVFGWVGVLFAFALARRLAGDRAAWLAAILLVAMPRYLAESMNNPKDLPFAVLMLAGYYYIVTIRDEYPYLSWPHVVKLGAVIALALNVRSMGLALLGYTAAALALILFAARERSLRQVAITAGRFVAVVAIALVGGTAFWPWAQESPFVRPIQAFFVASTFSWGITSLFAGRDVLPGDLPWYYLPTWLAISIPPVVIVGALFSLAWLAGVVRRDHIVSSSRMRIAALWAFALVPATAVIVKRLSLYDGIRHVFFLVPPLAVLAAIGWDAVVAACRPAFRTVLALLLAIGIAEPLMFDLRNHPNETVYFTPVIGGPRGAFGRFEMDYWGNCMLQAMDWSAQQAAQARIAVGVTGNAWEVAVVDKLRYPSLWFRRREHGAYHLDIRLLKGARNDVLDTAARPDVLHRVTTADGTPLCVVVPGPEYPELRQRLAGAAARDEATR